MPADQFFLGDPLCCVDDVRIRTVQDPEAFLPCPNAVFNILRRIKNLLVQRSEFFELFPRDHPAGGDQISRRVRTFPVREITAFLRFALLLYRTDRNGFFDLQHRCRYFFCGHLFLAAQVHHMGTGDGIFFIFFQYRY